MNPEHYYVYVTNVPFIYMYKSKQRWSMTLLLVNVTKPCHNFFSIVFGLIKLTYFSLNMMREHHLVKAKTF